MCPEKQYYSGPFTGSVCQSGDSGFFPEEIDVNIPGKYRFNPLFLEKRRFNPNLTC